MKVYPFSIEPLEARIAPASSGSYIDVDGDRVTVTLSSGTLSTSNGAGGGLELIDVTGATPGADLFMTVTKVPGGDGLANVGYINGTGVDLGNVTIKGDLGQIDCGSNTAGTPALKSLTVRSMGRLGLDSQGGVGDLQSDIQGALGALKVTGDVKDAFINVFGAATATLGSVTVGGSLIGGSSAKSGHISSEGDMGPVKIGRDVQGGIGDHSGLLESTAGKLASATVGGSLIGGSSSASGQIYSLGDMGAVKIAHDVRGGVGAGSGFIFTGGKLASVTLGGSLLGGDGESGQIHSGLDMGAVKIGHDVKGGAGTRSGVIESNARMTSVNLGGSLLGGAGDSSGQLNSDGDMGAVKIGHDVIGGFGMGVATGFIRSGANLASVTLGGSLIGGAKNVSAEIRSLGDMGPVKIGHDVQGGADSSSGYIHSFGKLTSVTLGGSLIGGLGDDSGKIRSGSDMGAVKIGHDLIGGSINDATGTLTSSGAIKSSGRIASVAVGGSIISGLDTSTGGELLENATIRAANDIGSITVKGSVIGNGYTATGNSPVVISARGQLVPGTTTDLAIGKISIGGRVEFANILAGYDTALTALNGDAQIGAVMVGGDWSASNLVAGAMNAASGNTDFGDAKDGTIGLGSPQIFAKIASITIGGQLFGTPVSVRSFDHFGFVAEQIGAVKIGGNTIALNDSTDRQPVGETTDVNVHKV